jgi:DNA gyrase subunit A
MATRIPPHNLTEVAGAVNLHVDTILETGADGKPIISIEEYMEHVKGPDFPTGASIHGIDGIIDMYATGKGRFHVRSKCDVFDDDKGKRIIIHEIPYQVKKADMLVQIADLVNKEVVIGIRDIRDESSKEGIRVVIEVKNNADPHAVLNQLFKSSRLQESYSANMMGILDGRPVLLDLPTMIHTYVSHRETVIERRAVFDLNKAKARAHILEGLVKAQDRIDDVVAVGKASASREQFERVLRGDETMAGIAPFDFSEAQAKAIAERRLFQLSRLDVSKVQDEHDELKLVIADLEDILASRPRRLTILKEELAELVDRHGDERRSFIDHMPLSMDREDLIEERAIVITLSEDNYIRHTPVETFRTQNRGGRGLKGVTTKTEDTPQLITACFSKDRLLIFTDQGRVYGLKAWETPLGSRQSRGSHIRNLLESLREDENIVSILPVSRELLEEPEDHYLLFATRLGLIKKTALSEYVRINRNGKYALRFKKEGDSLVNVRSATNEHDIVMISTTGYASRFNCGAIRASGRVSGGVYGIKVSDRKGSGGGVVAGMVAMLSADEHILTISKYGMAKRSRLGTAQKIPDTDAAGNPKFEDDGSPKMATDGYRRTKPGAKGVRTMKLDEEHDDSIISVRTIPDIEDHLFLLTKSGMMIRIRVSQTKETSGKSTRGTRVMELRNKAKGGFTDEIIFSSRVSASLLDVDDEEDESSLGEEE